MPAVASHHSSPTPYSRFAVADIWPIALFAIVLATLWLTMFERAAHDDDLVIQEAVVNHQNVAQSVTSHTRQILDRLSFYARKLSRDRQAGVASELIASSLDRDDAFLHLMHFSATGKLIFSTADLPDPGLMAMARRHTGQRRTDSKSGMFVIGSPYQTRLGHPWSLPVLYHPPQAGNVGNGFVIAQIDLGDFQRRFGNLLMGRSGEIVLVDTEGRELMRLHDGRLDFVDNIEGTERLQRAFSGPAGTVQERLRDAHDRLYAYRRVDDSPLAVLVSRTRYDILLDNQAVQRGYLLTALGMSALMTLFIGLWLAAAHRRRSLINRLARAQDDNARLIHQLEQEKQAVYQLATHDKLTGLANRMLFAEIASRYLLRAQRLRAHFAVIFIDLDRFKPINDTHGHKAGDQILTEVANRLQECMRSTDLVARFGGDEFVALVSDLHGSRNAAAIAGKIIENLSRPFVGIVADELFVTPSIGIALYPEDADEIESLVKQADGAMYQAKVQGRATYVFAEPSLNRRNMQKNQIQAALPLALKNGEIELHYQPKVCLQDFRIVGLEALARWHSPILGQVSPADFIPLAEENSLILDLGEYVVAKLCEQLLAWQQIGLPLVPVAINISPRQLRTPRFFDHVAATLAHHGIAAQWVEIEITETGLVEAGDALIEQLQKFGALGVRLAIDDFGTGFSGLSHLRALPAHYLKIDRSFIQNIRNDVNDATIVSSTITLAHKLNLAVIAEGVETREQLVHLRVTGCDQVQGYLFSPPLPAEELPHLLQQKYLCGEFQAIDGIGQTIIPFGQQRWRDRA